MEEDGQNLSVVIRTLMEALAKEVHDQGQRKNIFYMLDTRL